MFVSLKLVAQPFLLGPTISSFAAFYLLSPPVSHSLPFSRITEKKSLGIWMGTWKCCPRSFMSFVRYLALEGSRAGGLFPKSGNLDPLVRDLRIPDLGDPSRVLGSTPSWALEISPPSNPSPKCCFLYTTCFHDPCNEGRAQMQVDVPDVLISAQDLQEQRWRSEPVCKMEGMRMAEGKARVLYGNWLAKGSKRKVGIRWTP